MDLIINNGITAISLPADETGLLVQSVNWSARSDVTEYKSAADHGSVVARQDRNPVMSIGISAYLLSTTTGIWTNAIGTSVGASGLANYNLASVASAYFNHTWDGGYCLLDTGSVSADGQSNPKVDLSYKAYPFIA